MKSYLLVIDRVRTGGAERILIDYYNYLIKCGCKVDIFVLYVDSTTSPWLKGLPVTYGNDREVEANLASRLSVHVRIYIRLIKILNAKKYDVIFSFLEKSNLITYLSNFKKIRHICTVHNVLSIQYLKIKNYYVRKLWCKSISFAYNSERTTLITVSEQVKNDLKFKFDVNEDKIHVINNYIDAGMLSTKSKENITEYFFESDTDYIINIGRLSDQKNQSSLLYAYAYYLKTRTVKSKVHLIIMGEGENEKSLKEIIKQLNLEKVVSIIDFQLNPYKFLAKCKLLVLSSKFEGFPIVIAEARSLNIPFCGTTHSIPEEMFSDTYTYDLCTFKNLNEQDGLDKFTRILNSVLLSNSFKDNLLSATSKWNDVNDKEHQFRLYCEIALNERICQKNI